MAKKTAHQRAGTGVEVTTLTLRDGLQSTGVWKDMLSIVKEALREQRDWKGNGGALPETPAASRLREIATLMKETGYTGAEVFWGQSFQKHMIAEISPYEAIELCRSLFGDDFLLSGLGRGVNAVGFRPYGQDAIDSLVSRFAERGGAPGRKKIKMRIFDALNNPDNCASMLGAAARYNAAAQQQDAGGASAVKSGTARPEAAQGKLIHIEAALCYQPERQINKWGPDGEPTGTGRLFTDDYYVAYARKQIAAAEAGGSPLDSLVIKDMAGQLNAGRVAELLPKLTVLGLPVYLHMHCTNYASAVETIRKAAELGAAGVEVADWPLAGGTSHASVRDIITGMEDRLVPIDLGKLTELEQVLGGIFGDKDTLLTEEGTPTAHRDDLRLTTEDRLKLWQLGIPGGAMPAVMDLVQKTCKLKRCTLNEAIGWFEAELEELQGEIGWVPLVTPMADIVYTQAIVNMQNGRYTIVEDRFAKMILGHYGRYIDHATDEEIPFSPKVIAAVIDYCAGVRNKTKLALGGKAYPAPEVLRERKVLPLEMAATREKMLPLLRRAGLDPDGPEADEAIVTKLMEPPASTNLTERILLGPQQERLVSLLDAIRGKAGPLSRLFASDAEMDLVSDRFTSEHAEAVIGELLQRPAAEGIEAVLEREVAYLSEQLPEAEPDEMRQEVARLLEALLQNRYMENHVLMARDTKDIPFDTNLAFYFSQAPADAVSFRDAAVREQLKAKWQQGFQRWIEDPHAPPTPEAAYNNQVLHALLAGDRRINELVGE